MNNHKIPPAVTLDSRLLCAASFVRSGNVAADIGTDHAYLPIYLLQNGVCPRAVGSDINEGPISKAKANVEKYNLADKITLIHTDGLRGIEHTGATDIIICGMGGEVIIDIIRNASFVFDSSVRLILQPMSKQPKLRQYLIESGFAIADERLAKSDGKLYQCICAHFTSTLCAPYSAAELTLGRGNIARGDSGDGLFAEFVSRAINAKSKQLQGKIAGNADVNAERDLLAELHEINDKIKKSEDN
jgi:Predicted SAM-dependent methyltransferase